jgi:hypothetical protein
MSRTIFIPRSLVYDQVKTVELCSKHLGYVPDAGISGDTMIIVLNNDEDATMFMLGCLSPQAPGCTGCTGPYPFINLNI